MLCSLHVWKIDTLTNKTIKIPNDDQIQVETCKRKNLIFMDEQNQLEGCENSAYCLFT
jgi:hypothetical protein